MAVPYRIDTHVHDRDFNQAVKATISGTLKLASEQGVQKYIAMPNTDPKLDNEATLIQRLSHVHEERRGDWFTYMLATADEKQLEEAVHCHETYNEVAGLKLYAGDSTGNMGVEALEDQRRVYEQLVALDYTGVLIVHCEKAAHMNDDAFDPKDPITHATKARPYNAEVESAKEQIALAKETGFKGTIIFAHTSHHETLDLAYQTRKDGLDIAVEVTPHHLMWDWNELQKRGAEVKMNPPLRSPRDVALFRQKVLEYASEGTLPVILGTDHAPHEPEAKQGPKPASGFPSLTLYKNLVEEKLPEWGFEEEVIDNMTYYSIVNLYKEVNFDWAEQEAD